MHTYVFLGTKEHCLREEQQMIDNESSQFDRNIIHLFVELTSVIVSILLVAIVL